MRVLGFQATAADLFARAGHRRPAGLFAALLLLVASPCAGQQKPHALDPQRALSQYVVDHWDAKTGLPATTVVALAQTTDGYLWVGTEEALARFDGTRFTFFDGRDSPALSRPNIGALLAGDRGELWIGTKAGGLVRKAGQAFRQFNVADGLVNPTVNSIARSRDGSLWIGTNGGVSNLREGRFYNYTQRDGLAGDVVRAIAESDDGTIWIATEHGVSRIRDRKISPAPAGLPEGAARSVLADGKSVWVGWRGAGLSEILVETGEIRTIASPLLESHLLSIARTTDGAIWAGTNGGGLVRIRGDRIEAFPANDAMASAMVWSLLEDRDGNLWAGTAAAGLFRIKNPLFSLMGKRHGLSSDVVLAVLHARDGSLWIGTAGAGLNRLRDGVVTTFGAQDARALKVVLSLAEDDRGTIWIGSTDGLTSFDGERFATRTTQDGLSSNVVRTILPAPDGSLWVGTHGAGLDHVRADGTTNYTTRDGLTSNVISALRWRRDGSMIVAAETGLSFMKDGVFTVVPELAAIGLLSGSEDPDGTLWFASAGHGLVRVRGTDIRFFREVDGLFENDLHVAFDDGAGSFWCSSNRGLARVRRASLEAVALGKGARVEQRVFGLAHGLGNAELNGGIDPAATRDSSGRLWFPTVEGVAFVDPAEAEWAATPPRPLIEDVTVDGFPQPHGEPIVLEPGVKTLQIRITAIDLYGGPRLDLQYLLDGFDHGWMPAGEARVAHYTNVPAGEYRLRVRAVGERGPGPEAILAMTALPSFHETWLFRAGAALVLLLLGLFIHRWRVRAMHRREQELLAHIAERRRAEDELRLHIEQRKLAEAEVHQLNATLEKRVAERTASLHEANRELESFSYTVSHDLRSPLRAIDGFSALIGSHTELSADAQDCVRRVRSSVRQMSQLIDDLQGFFRLGRQPLERRRVAPGLLVTQCLEMLGADIEGRDLEIRCDDLPECTGDPGLLKVVWLNLLSNALKYTRGREKARVEVGSRRDGDQIVYFVRDNGTGFDMKHADKLFGVFQRLHHAEEFEGSGIGLATVQRIVNRHGGKAWAEAEPGKGAAFYFTIGPGAAHPTARSEAAALAVEERPPT